jgi:hypothetical protein
METMKHVVAIIVCGCVLFAGVAHSQDKGHLAYKIDGKEYRFEDATLEYSSQDGYLAIDAERIDQLSDPQEPNEKREVATGASIQLAGDEKSFVGVHEASDPDTMPVYFSWYEETKEPKEIKEYLASLDSGETSKMTMRLTIENFGPEGTLIKGTFSGRLLDDSGNLHEITDGTFSIPRKDYRE